MKPLIFPSSSIIFWLPLVLFISVNVPTSLCADDNRFASCRNEAISCGEVRDIKYPFWGENRGDYCGRLTELQVICEKDIPKLNISSVKYRILGWNQHQGNLTLARDDYWEDLCPNGSVNSTFNFTMFDYFGDIKNMTLFYQCNDDTNQLSQLHKQACTGTTTQLYVAIDLLLVHIALMLLLYQFWDPKSGL
ncbi:hypothetical protein L6164_007766 [Bauhinia variegata]|uniref:Uncharacterized protein n=1 Tax=Bauhinia variegata TaxID=167791 RepID=A0ACB9PEE7_BAUVA|nr:hypothetical protein L6164_007766 [Bauhinia variegata]